MNAKKEKTFWHNLLVCLSAAAFGVLLLSLNHIRILIISLIVLGSIILFFTKKAEVHFEKRYNVATIAILLFASARFCFRWLPSRKILSLASKLSLSSGTFLLLFSIVLSGFAFYGVNILLTQMASWKGPRLAWRKLSNHPFLLAAFSLFAIALIQFFQIQMSSLDEYSDLVQIGLLFLLIDLAILLAFNAVFLLAIPNRRIALIVTALALTVFSVVNHYVILLHGGPLFPSEFANATAATDVLSGYQISVTPNILEILSAFFVELFLILFILPKQDPKLRLRMELLRLALLAVNGALVYALVFSPVALKDYRWGWKASVRERGFYYCFVSNIKDILHPLVVPDGYNSEKIVIPTTDNTAVRQDYPDIILILNESFCDLSYYTDIISDIDYLEPFFGIDGATYGYAIASQIGGGTNNSEFELLTSDSMYLLTNYAPFNYIRFTDRNSTFLKYLKDLGYYTTVMHSRKGSNYSRSTAFPAMGFDRILLGEGSFSGISSFGNRPVTDAEEYHGMIELYKNDCDGPRFYYLLTFQNHGGYEQNDSSFDLVHITNDYGDLNDDLDEYLTSLYMSSVAFRELTDYYSTVDRPVIICMVGDHSPYFITKLSANDQVEQNTEETAMRMVPYVIWTNFDAELPDQQGLASMTDIAPLMLSYTNMPMTPYYQSIIDLHEKVPVRSSTGLFIDSDGNVGQYGNGSVFDPIITQYYYMEYNILADSQDYLLELTTIEK